MSRLVISASVLLTALVFAGDVQAKCRKDKDCKGKRSCVAGKCRKPDSAGAKPAPAAPPPVSVELRLPERLAVDLADDQRLRRYELEKKDDLVALLCTFPVIVPGLTSMYAEDPLNALLVLGGTALALGVSLPLARPLGDSLDVRPEVVPASAWLVGWIVGAVVGIYDVAQYNRELRGRLELP